MAPGDRTRILEIVVSQLQDIAGVVTLLRHSAQAEAEKVVALEAAVDGVLWRLRSLPPPTGRED